MTTAEDDSLPTVASLDELVAPVERAAQAGDALYVRWCRGPAADLSQPSSRDGLTGVELPGLSANPLSVEPWWGD